MAGYREYSKETVRELVKQELRKGPRTRKQLEEAIGVSQQRISEALTFLGATIVGTEPKQGKGRPTPIYTVNSVLPVNLLCQATI